MPEESLPDARDPMLGRVMAGKYHIDAFLGAGAMGRVYRATQRPLDKVVAVKVLNAALVSELSTQQRFLREAQAASRIDHPNSVAVFDFGREADGATFIVMEYLRGESLEELLQREGSVSPARCVAIMSQVLAALSEAHDHGVVHRDVKPENIMLVPRAGDDGVAVKVTDFGIAKVLDDDEHGASLKLTATGVIPGSPAYMSPEQARGREVDGRSDLYQCGVILYEMITGDIPFGGESAIEVIMRHLNDPAPSPRDRSPRCPAALEAVVLRAMEKDPARRFDDARAMRHALKVVAPDQVAATAPLARSERPTAEVIRPSVEARPTPEPAPAAPRTRAPALPPRVAVASVLVAASLGIAVALQALHPSAATVADASAALVVTRPEAATRPVRDAMRAAAMPEAAMALTVPTPAQDPVAEAPALRPRPRRAVRIVAHASAAPMARPAVEPEVIAPPPAPEVIAPPPAPMAVAHVPAPEVVAPVPALRGIDGSVVAVQVTRGLTRSAFQGRAAEATDALARCVFQSGALGSAMWSPVTVHGTVTVRDRRADEVHLSGAPTPVGCRAGVLAAFRGDLPQAEDTEYEVRLTMRLAPRR
jgi:eukaryotic-like serine/threonine-protein kinase